MEGTANYILYSTAVEVYRDTVQDAYVVALDDRNTKRWHLKTPTVGFGAWHHVMLVWQPNGTMQLYYDGCLIDTTNTPEASQIFYGPKAYLGCRGGASGRQSYLVATLDEMWMWSEAKSAEFAWMMFTHVI